MGDAIAVIGALLLSFGMIALIAAWQLILPVIGLLWLMGWLA